MAADNRCCENNFKAFRPPRGMPQIEVKFDIDANASSTAAKDLGTARSRSRITTQRADEEMRRCAKTPTARRGRQRSSVAEQRNQADSMCWQLEKLLKEQDAKLGAADKEAVSKAIEKTREAAKTDDLERIKSAVHELEQASHAGQGPVRKSRRPARQDSMKRRLHAGRPAATRIPSTPSSR
jgi:molecular chaperone DnaK